MENHIEVKEHDSVIVTYHKRGSNKVKYKIITLEVKGDHLHCKFSPRMAVTYDRFAYLGDDNEYHLIPIKEVINPILTSVWKIVSYRLLSTRLRLDYLENQKRNVKLKK